VLLDGTWRKAKKLWLNNPFLHELDACAIEPEHASKYRIRKRPNEQSLSTLEAIATTLSVVDGTPLAPFEQALNAMQQHWHDFVGHSKRQT
jgi:DTW domain-containing protein YfiP